MSLPFGMIFSIILIVFFLAAAFIGIKYFLNIQKCANIGLFISDFQDEVDRAWNTQESSFVFKTNLPSEITYVCFANLSMPFSGNSAEKDIFSALKKYPDYSDNLFFYPRDSACETPVTYIKHLNMTGMRNPYCIASSGNIEIKISKSFYDALVKVS